MTPQTRPLSLLAELTYRCPLQCPYCSNPLELGHYRQELDTKTWIRVLGEAADLGVVQLHLSGGEPLVRTDIMELVREARRLGFYSNMSTGATVVNDATLDQLREAGLDHLQVSLLDTQPENNDRLAGTRSFDHKRDAVLGAKRLGFPVTLNVVLHRQNLDHIEDVIALALEWKVDRLELAHTQYTGWAFRNRAALMPSRAQVERANAAVERVRATVGSSRLDILYVVPDYFEEYPKACLQGWGQRADGGRTGRVRPPVPDGAGNRRARVSQRPGQLAQRDLVRRPGVSTVPRHRLDARTVSQLRPPRDRLWRVPMPGIPNDRRRRRDGSRLPSVATASPGG